MIIWAKTNVKIVKMMRKAFIFIFKMFVLSKMIHLWGVW